MTQIKSNSINSIAFALALGISFFSCHLCVAGQIEKEDQCIKVVVDSIQRTDSLEEDFNSSLTPSTGSNFCVLKLILSEIYCGYVFPKQDMFTNTYIYDSEANSYPVINWFAQGIQFEDNSLSSTAAFANGSKIVLAFELPVQTTVSSIGLAYYHGSSWDDSNSPSSAEINFSLINDEIDGGYDIGSGIWMKAVLQVEGSPVILVWKIVGTDSTPSGDKVISGYFYASPDDFAYGSEYNPEVFVKVFIAKNGWCNIAFNHVTVDDVTIYSAHNYAGVADQTGSATLSNRLVEHQYNGVSLQ